MDNRLGSQLFWEGHKNWRHPPYGFDIYLRRNGANFCGLLRKAELYCPIIYIVFSMHSPSLQGSFQFSYSRGHGVCNYPKSSISQCSDASKLVFRYQVCNFLRSLFFSLLLIWNWCWTFEIWIEFSFVLEFVCFFKREIFRAKIELCLNEKLERGI